jgi:hypothetical protein
MSTFIEKINSTLSKSLRIANRSVGTCDSGASKTEVLCNQIIDSLIVGGITGVSTYVAAGEVASMSSAVLAFSLTFLIKMKEYRNIK